MNDDVKRYNCWCGSTAQPVDPACKTLVKRATYVLATDHDRIVAEKDAMLARATRALETERQSARVREAINQSLRDQLTEAEAALEAMTRELAIFKSSIAKDALAVIANLAADYEAMTQERDRWREDSLRQAATIEAITRERDHYTQE